MLSQPRVNLHRALVVQMLHNVTMLCVREAFVWKASTWGFSLWQKRVSRM